VRGCSGGRPSDRRSQLDGLDWDIASLHDCLLERRRSTEDQARAGTAISNSLGAIYSNCRSDNLFRPDALFTFGHMDSAPRMDDRRDGYLFRLQL
jgi:hypothetical protein